MRHVRSIFGPRLYHFRRLAEVIIAAEHPQTGRREAQDVAPRVPVIGTDAEGEWRQVRQVRFRIGVGVIAHQLAEDLGEIRR
jgi:hypothetical protein